MKRLNGFAVALALFGAINVIDAWTAFGGQAVDPPPTRFFLFSSWVFVRNTVGYSLLLASPALFFGRFSRFLLLPALWYVAIIEAASFYSGHVFHANLSETWLPLLLDTSPQELRAFVAMSVTPTSTLGTVAFLAAVLFASALLWRARYPRVSLRSSAAGAAACAPFIVFNCIAMNMHFGINQTRYTAFLYGGINSWLRFRGVVSACDAPVLPAAVSADAEKDALPSGVFVLGESSTRNSWHLYGYPRNTTPRMDRLCADGEAIRYDDVVGSQPDTVSALSLLLTDVTLDDMKNGKWNIAQVLRRAGYRCVLVSNQHSWGDTTSVLYKLFNGCEKRIVLSLEFKDRSHYDEVIPPILEEELGGNIPTIAFVHLAGIHYPVKDIHPSSETHFDDTVEPEPIAGLSDKSRDRINRYDNGILYEDKVLGMIVDVLKARSGSSFMFFISDHGESPRASGWRIYTDNDIYELPAIFWFSDGYRSQFPDVVRKVRDAAGKRLQTDQMTTGLLELALIAPCPEISDQASFLDPSFKGRNPRTTNKGKSIYSKDAR